MPLLLSLPSLYVVRAFKLPSIGTQSISSLKPYELDWKTLGTNTVYTLILCSDTVEGPVLVKYPMMKRTSTAIKRLSSALQYRR